MTSLKFYYDFLSQPCRAVGLLLESAQVEHEKCFINIVEGRVCGIRTNHTKLCQFILMSIAGQQRSEDYAKVCPAKQVPAIDDHGFCLSERYVVCGS